MSVASSRFDKMQRAIKYSVDYLLADADRCFL